ncbi:hypothetical protein B0A55_04454 [Friedmanniomyces simplex]|uniref:Zn(2)-C6 fungal-type domain-containing protein n=1 Tax=Friedmanniomyces simplex TaxID=329884 RepID=A0A4U0XQH0_9PEZI|nr:hypothetical protein B0A55_04454 [Friedmanniomyces simplex]
MASPTLDPQPDDHITDHLRETLANLSSKATNKQQRVLRQLDHNGTNPIIPLLHWMAEELAVSHRLLASCSDISDKHLHKDEGPDEQTFEHAIHYHQEISPRLREQVLQFSHGRLGEGQEMLQAASRIDRRREACTEELRQRLLREKSIVSRLRAQRQVHGQELARAREVVSQLQAERQMHSVEGVQAREVACQLRETVRVQDAQILVTRSKINDLRRERDDHQRAAQEAEQIAEETCAESLEEVRIVMQRAVEAEKRAGALEVENKGLVGALEESRREQDVAESTCWHLRKRLGRVNGRFARIVKQAEGLRTENATLEAAHERQSADLRRTGKQAQSLRKENAELKHTLKCQHADFQRAGKQVEGLKRENEVWKGAVKQQLADSSRAGQQTEWLQAEIETLKGALEQREGNEWTAGKQVEGLRSENATLKEALQRQHAAARIARDDLFVTQARREILEKESSGHVQAARLLQDSFTKACQEHSNARQELTLLKRHIAASYKEKTATEQQTSQLHAELDWARARLREQDAQAARQYQDLCAEKGRAVEVEESKIIELRNARDALLDKKVEVGREKARTAALEHSSDHLRELLEQSTQEVKEHADRIEQLQAQHAELMAELRQVHRERDEQAEALVAWPAQLTACERQRDEALGSAAEQKVQAHDTATGLKMELARLRIRNEGFRSDVVQARAVSKLFFKLWRRKGEEWVVERSSLDDQLGLSRQAEEALRRECREITSEVVRWKRLAEGLSERMVVLEEEMEGLREAADGERVGREETESGGERATAGLVAAEKEYEILKIGLAAAEKQRDEAKARIDELMGELTQQASQHKQDLVRVADEATAKKPRANSQHTVQQPVQQIAGLAAEVQSLQQAVEDLLTARRAVEAGYLASNACVEGAVKVAPKALKKDPDASTEGLEVHMRQRNEIMSEVRQEVATAEPARHDAETECEQLASRLADTERRLSDMDTQRRLLIEELQSARESQHNDVRAQLTPEDLPEGTQCATPAQTLSPQPGENPGVDLDFEVDDTASTSSDGDNIFVAPRRTSTKTPLGYLKRKKGEACLGCRQHHKGCKGGDPCDSCLRAKRVCLPQGYQHVRLEAGGEDGWEGALASDEAASPCATTQAALGSLDEVALAATSSVLAPEGNVDTPVPAHLEVTAREGSSQRDTTTAVMSTALSVPGSNGHTRILTLDTAVDDAQVWKMQETSRTHTLQMLVPAYRSDDDEIVVERPPAPRARLPLFIPLPPTVGS